VIALEEITSACGQIIAIVIKKDFKKSGINFISKNDFPLQLGINSYAKGSKIKPHVHLDREVRIRSLQEVVYIKNGTILVNLYDSNRLLFKSFKLSTGDLIFFVSGGHGFEILKDSTIIEVKQGPYFGKDQDKTMIE
jgi:hypothetical protein